MNLTNDSYLILIGTKNFTERYFRDKSGWLKVSARGRTFRMTAEQVLNHVLPAAAGMKPNLSIKVEHHKSPISIQATRRTSRVERTAGSGSVRGRIGRRRRPAVAHPDP